MSGQRPPNLTISQLLRADLARKRSIRLVEHVLAADLNLSFEMLAHEQEEEAGRGDDDFCVFGRGEVSKGLGGGRN